MEDIERKAMELAEYQVYHSSLLEVMGIAVGAMTKAWVDQKTPEEIEMAYVELFGNNTKGVH